MYSDNGYRRCNMNLIETWAALAEGRVSPEDVFAKFVTALNNSKLLHVSRVEGIDGLCVDGIPERPGFYLMLPLEDDVEQANIVAKQFDTDEQGG